MENLQQRARQADADDALRGFRERFYQQDGTIYLDGNSLGLLSTDAEQAVLGALEDWKKFGIGGWTQAQPPWFTLSEQLAAITGPVVGARDDEVIVSGSTTVNLHQLLATFYRPQGVRVKILADRLNFPSDLYALQSHLLLRGRAPQDVLVEVVSRDGRTLAEKDVLDALSGDVQLCVLPAVLYRSGQLLDVEGLTRAAHERGVVIGWDLCHSAGVVPHALHDWGVDFAFWCNYKYLNGGPGAVASLFVHEKHRDLRPGMWGWFGSDKRRQFDMLPEFHPAQGAGAMQIGTPHILSAAALRGSLTMVAQAGVAAIRRKSLQQTQLLIDAADALLAPYGFQVGTPREEARRGGHVALEHPRATQIAQALRDHGVIPDFRPPDVVRLGPNPLYTSFTEIVDAVRRLERIMADEAYLRYPPERGDVA